MGKFLDAVTGAIQSKDATALIDLIEKGIKRKKVLLPIVTQIEDKYRFPALQKAIQGVKAILTLKPKELKANRMLACAFEIETVLSPKKPYIKRGKYALQHDPEANKSYIHLHRNSLGQGGQKLVVETIQYSHESAKLLVVAEEKGARKTNESIEQELLAHRLTKGLSGIIQSCAILSRVSKKGDVRTAVIMKKYSPGAIDKAKRLTIAEQSDIALQLLQGLKNLHACNLVHRDLKPKNILYDSATKEAVLADLGQVQTLQAAKALPPNASRFYNPPEALRKKLEKNDPRKCDLFSLGCVLYTMHTDKPLPWMRSAILPAQPAPSTGRRERFIKEIREVRNRLKQALKQDSHHAKGLKQVILGMLHDKPEKRPSIDTLISQLTR